jgi:hypothetical protein
VTFVIDDVSPNEVPAQLRQKERQICRELFTLVGGKAFMAASISATALIEIRVINGRRSEF